MDRSANRRIARTRRRRRVRLKVRGTDERPRVSYFRSNRHVYVQVISDESGRTLVALSTLKDETTGVMVEKASGLGTRLAEACKKAGIERAVVDRGGYRYHGRLRALTEAAREAGLKL